jgi:hypothetical protein
MKNKKMRWIIYKRHLSEKLDESCARLKRAIRLGAVRALARMDSSRPQDADNFRSFSF